MIKKTLKIVAALVLIVLITLYFTIYPKLDLVTGFSSKSVASWINISNRTAEDVKQTDNNFDIMPKAKNTVKANGKIVEATIFGFKKRTAIYREGLGALLIDDDYDIAKKVLKPHRDLSPINKPYPYGDLPQDTLKLANVDYKKLSKAIANAFDKQGENSKKTRSVLVLYNDKIIGEQYATGFTKETPILGWSMTKSIVGTLYGILQKQGKLDINKPTKIPSWQNDTRKNITYNDLLHMNSGLAWEERYDKISDVTKMLFLAKDMPSVQQEKLAEHQPNTHWVYSSGTSNLLGSLLHKFTTNQQEYLDMPYQLLLDKIGMHSALLETDMEGNYVYSSYGWATTRDWAKFGTLYLHRGNWDGEQLFNPSWADYVATPTPTSNNVYGAHFWLNKGGIYPDVPRDLYSANGFQGQKVFIIPSTNMVIVRTGLTEGKSFDFNSFLRDIIAAVDTTKAVEKEPLKEKIKKPVKPKHAGIDISNTTKGSHAYIVNNTVEVCCSRAIGNPIKSGVYDGNIFIDYEWNLISKSGGKTNTFKWKNSTIRVYANPRNNKLSLVGGTIRDRSFKLGHGLRIGMTKKHFLRKIFKNTDKITTKNRFEIQENSRMRSIYTFKNDKLATVQFQAGRKR